MNIPLNWDVDAIVLGAIVASVILSFILLVIVFAMRYKAQNERVLDLEKLVKEKEERNFLLSENMRKMQAKDILREKKLEECSKLEENFEKKRKEIEAKLEEAYRKIDILNGKIVEISKLNEELESSYSSARENLELAIEEVEKAQKRSEFWVEQLSELRTKYEALRMRMKRLEK